MDIASLSIGVFLFAIFVGPIIYIIIKQRSSDTSKLKILRTVASNHELSLDKTEIIGHISLGLDSSRKRLVIIDHSNADNARVMDLTKVDQIKVSQRLEPYYFKNIRKDRILHVALELGERQVKLAEITFYDEDDLDSTDAEVRLHDARKWDELLHKSLAF